MFQHFSLLFESLNQIFQLQTLNFRMSSDWAIYRINILNSYKLHIHKFKSWLPSKTNSGYSHTQEAVIYSMEYLYKWFVYTKFSIVEGNQSDDSKFVFGRYILIAHDWQQS